VVKQHVEERDRELTSQIQRALHSIVLNVAEGSGCASDTEFARFLSISMRSTYETVAAFDLATLYGFIDENLNLEIEERAFNLVRQLASFRSTLRSISQ
jgi:four helix bundle protein